MNRYTNAELADSHFIYGLANENGRASVRVVKGKITNMVAIESLNFHLGTSEHGSFRARIDDTPVNFEIDLEARISIAAATIRETPGIFEHVRQSMSRRRRDFIRLWSEFRYGIFPEGGFAEDEKYPAAYRMPNEEVDRATECKTEPKGPQDDCDGNTICEKECREECKEECEIKCKEKCKGKCKNEPIVSSLMDQNVPSKVRML
ncbi:calcium-activated chloride channel regulator 1 [Trichonephila clavipes]|uniref:Calcium-activated chloride channel regulator 1 n=1 Tax=Trichonephila clavipes TaxID=2585209 RepID=A0A8X6VXZ0_TRICX|nr:calcium-activated chloride channel regulator 1 [Trichonephila clavipes]